MTPSPTTRLSRVRPVVVFVAVLFAGIWPMQSWRESFASGYSELVNETYLKYRRFGGSASATLVQQAEVAGTNNQHVSQDAVLQLRVESLSGIAKVGVSVRRDAYLPLLVGFALICAGGLRRKDAFYGVFVVGVASYLSALVALELFIRWLFMFGFRVEQVYPLIGTHADAVDAAFRFWLTPPLNRFVPGVVAALLWIAACRARGSSAPDMPTQRSDRSRAPATTS